MTNIPRVTRVEPGRVLLSAVLVRSQLPSQRLVQLEVIEQVLTVDAALPEVEELQKLVAEGQEKGYLSYDEIATALDDVEITKEQAEDFYTYLTEHNVELVEGEQHKAPPLQQPQR